MAANIRIDSSAFERGLNDLERKQFPFAMAKTLTDAAKHGQGKVRKQTREAFDLHTDFIPSQILVTPAKKSDYKTNTMQAEVRTTEKIQFMTPHEKGGLKKPQGKALAVPTFSAQRQIKNLKTKTGRINPKFMPKRLIEGWPPGQNRGYTQEGVLFKRLRRKDKEAFPFFSFETVARIKPTWEYEDTIRAALSFPWLRSSFTRNLLFAMRSL